MSKEKDNISKRAAVIALLTGVGMLVAKMGAYLLTNSAAIFSDALESVVHIFASFIAFVSIIVSSRPEDESHPYGHGNIEFFSAGFEGLLIIGAAIAIIYAALHALIFGIQVKALDIGLYIVAGAGVVNAFLGFYLIRTGKKTNSITLIADGKHVLTDSYTSVGVVLGIIMVLLTGYTILDPIFAIAIAINIIFTGVKLVRVSFDGLMDASDPEMLNSICTHLAKIKKDFWIDIHQLRVRRSGNKLFHDFHLVLPYYFTIKETHAEEKRLLEEINVFHSPSELKIHLDHCDFTMCSFCRYTTCTVRKSDINEVLEFTPEKIIGPPRVTPPSDEQLPVTPSV